MAKKKKAEDQPLIDASLAKQPIVPAYTPSNQPESPDAPKLIARLRKAILACIELSEKERVTVYNAATSALRSMVSDLCDDPVLSIKLIPSDDVVANDYNPNKVATPEMDLLEQSILADGVTMPVVTFRNAKQKQNEIVDGFHRQDVLKKRFKRKYIPCSEIDKPIAERIASTIRHNRARGKHQVDLMAGIVSRMMSLGCDDATIAKAVGMTEEELLRLKQVAGVAKLLAANEYSQSWGLVENADGVSEDTAD